MNFNLRHLRYFVTLAEEQNFARAAARLHMTQPPLSQQIMQFEEMLGVALFIRGKRPLRLTAAGEELLPEARRLLVGAEAFRESANRMARGSRGALTLAFVVGALPDLLPTLLEAYRALHPDVQIHLQSTSKWGHRCRIDAAGRRFARYPHAGVARRGYCGGDAGEPQAGRTVAAGC